MIRIRKAGRARKSRRRRRRQPPRRLHRPLPQPTASPRFSRAISSSSSACAARQFRSSAGRSHGCCTRCLCCTTCPRRVCTSSRKPRSFGTASATPSSTTTASSRAASAMRSCSSAAPPSRARSRCEQRASLRCRAWTLMRRASCAVPSCSPRRRAGMAAATRPCRAPRHACGLAQALRWRCRTQLCRRRRSRPMRCVRSSSSCARSCSRRCSPTGTRAPPSAAHSSSSPPVPPSCAVRPARCSFSQDRSPTPSSSWCEAL